MSRDSTNHDDDEIPNFNKYQSDNTDVRRNAVICGKKKCKFHEYLL